VRKTADWGGVVAAFIAVIAVNGAANALPIGGKTTGQVSAIYESLFTPAGFTFSIWSLIYFGLLLYVIVQALPAQRCNETLATVGRWFLISCAFNAVWMFCWHYEQITLSMVMMLGILYSLTRIYRTLGEAQLKGLLFWTVTLPFSIYVGWITVATIANISALQTALDLNDWLLSAESWTFVKLAVAGLAGAVIAIRKLDIAYVLVVAWAANGVAVKQVAVGSVAGSATTLSILGLLLAGYALFKRLRS